MLLFLVTPCLIVAFQTCMEWIIPLSVYWLWHLLSINFLVKKVNKILTWPGAPLPLTHSLSPIHLLIHSITHSLNYLEMMGETIFFVLNRRYIVGFINFYNINFAVFSLQGSNYLFEVPSWKFILSKPNVGWIKMKTYSPTYFPSP